MTWRRTALPHPVMLNSFQHPWRNAGPASYAAIGVRMAGSAPWTLKQAQGDGVVMVVTLP